MTLFGGWRILPTLMSTKENNFKLDSVQINVQKVSFIHVKLNCRSSAKTMSQSEKKS